MGESTAEDLDTVEDLEVEQPDDVEVVVDDATVDAEDGGEDQEIEIVREVEGSQPSSDSQTGIRKRINKLNSKVDSANEETAEARNDLAAEREKTKILEIALGQAKNAGKVEKAPNPDDFDDGVNDPAYIKKQGDYTQSIIAKQVATQVAEATRQTEDTVNLNAQSQQLQRQQVEHYERAEKIGAKDYAETEDKALAILGNDIANQVIGNFKDSHILLYYLGKNTSEAERLANLLISNPIQGVAEFGRLSSQLKIKPKTSTTPEPDEELKGDSPAAMDVNERKLNKLREEAAKTGDMKPLMDFRRKIAAQ